MENTESFRAMLQQTQTVPYDTLTPQQQQQRDHQYGQMVFASQGGSMDSQPPAWAPTPRHFQATDQQGSLADLSFGTDFMANVGVNTGSPAASPLNQTINQSMHTPRNVRSPPSPSTTRAATSTVTSSSLAADNIVIVTTASQ
jgi:hypothetical protein